MGEEQAAVCGSAVLLCGAGGARAKRSAHSLALGSAANLVDCALEIAVGDVHIAEECCGVRGRRRAQNASCERKNKEEPARVPFSPALRKQTDLHTCEDSAAVIAEDAEESSWHGHLCGRGAA